MTDSNKVAPKLAPMPATHMSHQVEGLRPLRHGKQPTRTADKKLEINIQVFRDAKKVQRRFATLANNGTISFFELQLVRVANSETNAPGLKTRPVFLSTAKDPNQYTNKRDGAIIYGDSNTQTMINYNRPNSGYNSLFLTSNIGTVYIPFTSVGDSPELVWDNVKHNAHVDILSSQLDYLFAMNLPNEKLLQACAKAWAMYQTAEKALIDSGVVIQNSVLIAVDSGVVPATSAYQEMSSANSYYDGASLFGNEKSVATYCPILNNVMGTLDLTSTQEDPNTNWTYGLIEPVSNYGTYGSNDKSSENAAQTGGYKSCSVEAIAYDFLNQKSASPVRIVIGDANINSKISRAESFESYTQKEQSIQLHSAQLQIGFALGGNSSIFSLQGNRISYTSPKAVQTGIADGSVTDMDSNLEFSDDSPSNSIEVPDYNSTFETLLDDDTSYQDIMGTVLNSEASPSQTSKSPVAETVSMAESDKDF